MEFFYRHATPVYKGTQVQPTQPTGLLSELGAMLGGATPVYKNLAGASAQAPTPSRSWLRAFAVTPSYKTAAPCTADHVAPGEPSPDGENSDEDPAGECSEPAMQVVIL